MASDSDEEFDVRYSADIESVQRAFLFGGADFSGHADDAKDDFEPFYNIQKRYGLSTVVQLPLDGGEYEGSFEKFQSRFVSYNDENTKEGFDKELHKPEQVGATNITSVKDSCNNFILERTNAGEAFPVCADGNDDNSFQILGKYLAVLNNGSTENASNILPKSYGSCKFVQALNKNRDLRGHIESKKVQIEARIEELKRLKGRVKLLRDFQVSCRKTIGRALAQKMDSRVQLICIQKRKINPKLNERKCSALCYAPPENSVVATYRDALVKFPVSVNRKTWSKEERENLLPGVKQQVKKTLRDHSIDSRSDMDGSFGDKTNIDSSISSIKGFDVPAK